MTGQDCIEVSQLLRALVRLGKFLQASPRREGKGAGGGGGGGTDGSKS